MKKSKKSKVTATEPSHAADDGTEKQSSKREWELVRSCKMLDAEGKRVGQGACSFQDGLRRSLSIWPEGGSDKVKLLSSKVIKIEGYGLIAILDPTRATPWYYGAPPRYFCEVVT